METIKKTNGFTKALENLKAEREKQKTTDSKNIDQFDFHGMFLELEKNLKRYQNEHATKGIESEIKLAELTLTA